MDKRRGNIVIQYTTCAIIVLIGYPSSILFESEMISTNSSSLLYTIVDTVEDILFSPFYITLILILVRYWLIYYDLQFSNSCLNLEWKETITTCLILLRKDRWWVSHRGTLGNATYIIKRVVFLSVILTGCLLSTVYLYQFKVINIDIYQMVSIVLFMTEFIVLVLLYYKTPTFEDNIYLCKEMKYITLGTFLSISLYAACVAYYFLHGQYRFMFALIKISAIISVFVGPFVSTFWVIKHVKYDPFISLSISSIGKMPELQVAQHSGSLEVIDILQNEGLFSQFMQHLQREFSMENLLALVEFIQYRQRFIEVFDISKEQDVRDPRFNISFPDVVPLSDIVYDLCNRQKIALLETVQLMMIKKKSIYKWLE